MGDHAHVDHVDDLAELVAVALVLLVGRVGLLGQLLERHGEEPDVVADRQVQVEVVAVDADRARLELADVVGGGLRVHADQDLRVEPVADVALGAGPDVEPGRQPLDVRGEDVLAAARDAHRVQGAEQDQVGRLAPEPLTVPTRIARSLTEAWDGRDPSRAGSVSTTERVDGMVCLEEERGHHGQFRRHASGVPVIDPRGNHGC